jgi:hypothetical protein
MPPLVCSFACRTVVIAYCDLPENNMPVNIYKGAYATRLLEYEGAEGYKFLKICLNDIYTISMGFA